MKKILESPIHFHQAGTLVALVGNPNCGKTALFNLLTGSQQKVANYAGVTVERKEGKVVLPSGRSIRLLDLPGMYSLYPRSLDEKISQQVLLGQATGEKKPDWVICVVDATNLRRSLRLVLAVKRLNIPCVVALNLSDVAEKRGLFIDDKKLSQLLNLPVVKTVGIQKGGDTDLRACIDQVIENSHQKNISPSLEHEGTQDNLSLPTSDPESDHRQVQQILACLGLDQLHPNTLTEKLDRFFLNPVLGPLCLMTLLFLIFQAVFSWAETPMEWIESATNWLGGSLGQNLSDGWFKSLLVDGVIAGVGGVLVFLPQILILFFFILILEESGYLPRAAFLLDRLMGSVGLSGRSFIPLLSSFACAIPGIMATRTISNQRDRWVTILIAPLMTCSARLPVYALLIGAFIPKKEVWFGFELQGLILFGLYILGILSAMLVAWVLKRVLTQQNFHPLMMELPDYHWPNFRNLLIGLKHRTQLFLKRVGGVILVLTLILWVLSSYPTPPVGAEARAIEYSFAGMIGKWLSFIFEPIGFNWQIVVALIPGMAAREVAVSALGTVYALSGENMNNLGGIIANTWSLATSMSLLIWYVFAPQCLSTIATIKRETGGWKMPMIVMGYLFLLAYIASFITYHLVSYLTAL
jgi:ferrous iron transport protein B